MKGIKIRGPEKLPQVRWFSYGYGYSVDSMIIFSRHQRPHGKIEVGIYRPKAQRLNHQHGYSVEFVTKYDIDAFPQNLILLISF